MTNPPGAMPSLPEPFGHIHDGNGNQPLSFDRGPIPWERSIGCSTQEVYSFAQLQAYAAPLIARVAELEAERAKMALSKIDRECLRIGQQIHRAAGDLPDTYEIEIEIERGSGSVYLSKPDYTKVAFNDHIDGLSESIKDAIDAAIAAKD